MLELVSRWKPDRFTSGNPGYLLNLNAASSSIWNVDVESGELTRVTEDTHDDSSPVWTADGRSLLFVSGRGGGRDIYRVSLDAMGRPDGDPERLTTGLNVFTIASSADGRTLSYSVATIRQNVWFLPVPLDGATSVSEARPVTTGNQRIEGVDVSSDGRWLVFNSDLNGTWALYKMMVGGGEPVPITSGPLDFRAAWSPDGREVAFHAIRGDSRDVFVVSADGGPVRQLTNDPAQEFYPQWSPDGTRIVFHSNRNGVPRSTRCPRPRGSSRVRSPCA